MRANLNASRKSNWTGLSEAIICLNRPDSVLYLMSPMASGPTPSALQPGSGSPFMNRSIPSTPAGGTALTSAITLRSGESLVLLGDDLDASGCGGENNVGVGDDVALLVGGLATAFKSTPKRSLEISADLMADPHRGERRVEHLRLPARQ